MGLSPAVRLQEACGLAEAISLTVVDAQAIGLEAVRPASLLGTGKTEELAAYIEEASIELVIIDGSLTPIQQKNLEVAFRCKVIDRTALILEIFGARAQTAEGKLQVELAALEYQKGRLVRSWTHLERQRGGFGFLGGPGESQIEIDRRLIRERIAKIKKELQKVVRTRDLQRKHRKTVPYPVIALVGYTNAGKSTLFNRLTGANVMSADMLFATLDPTMRAVRLPNGITFILSDTVGFISDLPTELVAAFRATLEEVVEADVILHVRDITHPETLQQKAEVEAIVERLFSDNTHRPEWLEVANKIDLLPKDVDTSFPTIGVSAHTGEGVAGLLAHIEQVLREHFFAEVCYALPNDHAEAVAFLYKYGNVQKNVQHENTLCISTVMTRQNIERFNQQFDMVPQ